MWLACNDDGGLRIFISKPIKKDGEWYVRGLRKDYGYPIDNYVGEINSHMQPIEIILLPKPTIESIVSNPIYNNIYNMGKQDERDYLQR